MKPNLDFRTGVLLAIGFGVGVLLSASSGGIFGPLGSQANAQEKTPAKPTGVGDEQLDARTVSDHLPDQSHVMADVGYHFANL